MRRVGYLFPHERPIHQAQQAHRDASRYSPTSRFRLLMRTSRIVPTFTDLTVPSAIIPFIFETPQPTIRAASAARTVSGSSPGDRGTGVGLTIVRFRRSRRATAPKFDQLDF